MMQGHGQERSHIHNVDDVIQGLYLHIYAWGPKTEVEVSFFPLFLWRQWQGLCSMRRKRKYMGTGERIW
jgi:hypothetical protein